MFAQIGAFLTILTISNASVLLWSKKHFDVPSLKLFTHNELASLNEELNNPSIFAFQGDLANLREIQSLMKNHHRTYLPSSDLNLENVTVLSGNPQQDLKTIREKLSENDDYLAIITDGKRTRRFAEESPFDRAIPSGGILYVAGEGEAMIYSSQEPFLAINNFTVNLGKAAMCTMNTKNAVTKINVNIPVDEGKVLLLKFYFNWEGSYWNFMLLEVKWNENKYNLTSPQKMWAQKRFSYHCSGETVLQNEDKTAQIVFYDLQMQPDTVNKFGDAYDCVNSMTAPIWSGILVTLLLLTILGFGIGALNDIKTMDKFENNKKKQLTITVAGE